MATLNRGERKYRRGSMGWSECRSQATNPSMRATPPASAAMTSGDDHPCVGPSMIAQRISPRAPIESRAPAGSAGRGS